MKPEVWKFVWSEFCESHLHLDSLLSQIPADVFGVNAKADVAQRFGPFLRRPWSLAQTFGISLAESPEAFWAQNFIALKKNQAVHETLERLTHPHEKLPTEGTRADFPTEIVKKWDADWGTATTDRLCALLSQDPLTVIRVNRNTVTEAATLFPKSRAGRFSPRARVFKGYEMVLNTDTYREGGLEIQDEGSQVMAWFTLYPELFKRCLSETPQIQKQVFDAITDPRLEAPTPLTLVDACAGAGGKTLALADFLKGQGRIFGYDVYERKIQALKRRASRASETNIQAIALDPDSLKTVQQKFAASADRVLIDSPCSGEGVLRRNPDIKWSRKPLPKEKEKVLTIEELQHQVIRDYLPLVKKGGRLVYGVCTFDKSETEAQLKTVIDEAKSQSISLELKEHGFLGPYETDGFFMASFERI